MPDNSKDIDWTLTTWEGSRREQMRRWSELSLDDILEAQEEMANLGAEFSGVLQPITGDHPPRAVVREEPPPDYAER